MDLNTIVKQYKVWNDTSAEEELRTLKNELNDVPVDITNLAAILQHKGGNYANLFIEAELANPQLALPIFGSLEQDEADRIESNLQVPFAFITFDVSMRGKYTGRLIRYNFTSCLKPTNGAIVVDDGSRNAGIVYERNGQNHLVEFFVK